MQTIRITNLRPELTGVLRDLDRPVAITKYGKIVAWLVSPSHSPLTAPTVVDPATDPFESAAFPSITSGLLTSGSLLVKDEVEDWPEELESDFERYLSRKIPEDGPLY